MTADPEQFCRDIKLENIFIGADGRVKLGDFGLTMSMKQEVAISPVGTVEYMAPEVNSICIALTSASGAALCPSSCSWALNGFDLSC